MIKLPLFRRLRRDERGATVVEFAFAFPALIVLIYMIAQLGMVYRAVSGIQHSLGEGARAATIWPRPSETTIRQRMTDAVYGIGPGSFTITTTPTATTILLTVSYRQETSLLLFPGPTINVSRSKLVYTVT